MRDIYNRKTKLEHWIQRIHTELNDNESDKEDILKFVNHLQEKDRSILGRYNGTGLKIDSCCSVLEQQSNKGFLSNMLSTFGYFIKGIKNILYLKNEPNLKYILKTSMLILITAESACILTAETIGVVFYNYTNLLAIPLALIVGALTVVFIEAYKKVNNKTNTCKDGNNNGNLVSLK
jgi:hypothetical protein